MRDLFQRERVVERYKHLVKPIAARLKRTLPAWIEMDDLMQEGLKALWDASQKFSRKRAASFEFYVRMRIRGAMIDSIKGRRWQNSMHQEIPEGLQIRDVSPTAEQKIIGMEEAMQKVARRRRRLEMVNAAIEDPDTKFHPLSEKQKTALDLRYRAGLPQAAAGAAMGVSQQSLHTLERRALDNVRRKLVSTAAAA